MKLKQWLAVMMAVLLVVYAVPVYATGSGEEEGATEELSTEELVEDEEESLDMSSIDEETGYLETKTQIDAGSVSDLSVEIKADEESEETESEELEKTESVEPEIEKKADDEAEIVNAVDDIARGTCDDISWVIDKDGKLTVTGTGEFHSKIASDIMPWYDNRDSILSAEISIKDITNLEYMFYNCKNLRYVNLDRLDSSKVTNMGHMFDRCSALNNIELNNLKTNHVVNMSYMFYGCNSLDAIDLSGFDTGNVIYIDSMFEDCSSIENLDLSNFNTSNVIYMEYMFRDCTNLKSVDVSSFNTSKVTCIKAMFFGCDSLENLDLSSFDLSNVGTGDACAMFGQRGNLNVIKTPKNVVDEISLPVTAGYSWYYDGIETTLVPKGFNVSVELKKSENAASTNIAGGVYADTSWVIDKNGKLTVSGRGEFSDSSYGDFGLGYWAREPWFQYRDSILSAEVSIESITNLSCMFYECRNMTNIDLRGLDTSSVTDLQYMFYECENLTSIDVSGFNTSNVTNMNRMFFGCNNLTNIDVSGFDTGNVTGISGMFFGCNNLEDIDVSGFNTSKVTTMSEMFGYCWGLTTIDVSNFDTENVIDMSRMFDGCDNLKDIDVSGFNTSKVTTTRDMFYGCRNLTNLDVSGFDTSKVTDMSGMFLGCSKLMNLDVSGFNTKNVTRMYYMFSGCKNLTNLDVSGFDTSNVINMYQTFSGCSSLTNLDVSRFNTSKVKDMNALFRDCSSLKDIDLSGFDLNSIGTGTGTGGDTLFGNGDTDDMFSGCTSLDKIKVPKNITVEIMLPISANYVWLYNGTEITSLPQNLDYSVEIKRTEKNIPDDNIASGTYDNITWVIDKNGKLTVTGTGEFATLSPENEDAYWTRAPWYEKRESILSAEINVTGIRDAGCMFQNCSNLKSIDVRNFDTSQIANMEHMFYGCSSLENLDTSGFQTQNVILMDGMFEGCASLKTLDVSGFDTGNVTWMANMFCGCSSLESLNVSSFNISQVGKIYGMFEGCSSLESLDLSSFDTQRAIEMHRMFYECSSLKNINFGARFNAQNVTNMARMFYGCSSIESLDLSSFDTKNVTYMQHMFRGCTKLKGINFGNAFDTRMVTNMRSMFRECSSLEGLNLSGFNTNNVTDMAYMFTDCNLKSIDVSGFNTDNVSDMTAMFRRCHNLESLNLSSFYIVSTAKADFMLKECESLSVIQTPKNVTVEITLPTTTGYSWYYNETEITTLPQNLSMSVKITKDVTKTPEEPPVPEIITIKVENAVQNVPYEAVLENNGWDAASYHISSGALPEGISLGTDGVIYGITKETGKFNFTVTMTVNGVSATAEKTYTLEVLKDTDKNVDAVADIGYEIIQSIQDINITQEITDQLFISKGPFEEFRNAYIDGDKLVQNVDYTAESGSTRITIKAETLGKLEKGKHTLGVEFRTEEGSLKRVAQNFDANSGKAKKGGGSKSGGSSGTDSSSGNTSQTKVTVTAGNVMETTVDDTIYYSVFLPSDDAILRLSFFNKVYGNNATILAYLDNGIGYSLNMNAFLSAGKDLNLSTKETELAGFAQGFKTIWLSIKEKTQLGYDLGINVNAGTEYANHPAYLFIFDETAGTFIPYGGTAVSESGNVGFFTKYLTDFIIMVAQ